MCDILDVGCRRQKRWRGRELGSPMPASPPCGKVIRENHAAGRQTHARTQTRNGLQMITVALSHQTKQCKHEQEASTDKDIFEKTVKYEVITSLLISAVN